ncbi:hypothetical protein [Halomicrococcus sp. SG-WS-1]|uniref:hypothetical protein n=1 Tax=Halomicrococcus sp. SG-WS-1 TaxID=3439057 RepID=UPI003F798F07
MAVELDQVDDEVTHSSLLDSGIEIANISATVDIEGEFDRGRLAVDLPNSEYNPEKHRSLIYRSPTFSGFTVLLPPAGRASLAGAKDKETIVKGVEEFMSLLGDLGLNRGFGEIQIENIVATTELDIDLDLAAVVTILGFERSEYEPEQFPGVIYRSPDGPVTLIFSSGKIVITKVETYEAVLSAYDHIKRTLYTTSEIRE